MNPCLGIAHVTPNLLRALNASESEALLLTDDSHTIRTVLEMVPSVEDKHSPPYDSGGCVIPELQLHPGLADVMGMCSTRSSIAGRSRQCSSFTFRGSSGCPDALESTMNRTGPIALREMEASLNPVEIHVDKISIREIDLEDDEMNSDLVITIRLFRVDGGSSVNRDLMRQTLENRLVGRLVIPGGIMVVEGGPVDSSTDDWDAEEDWIIFVEEVTSEKEDEECRCYRVGLPDSFSLIVLDEEDEAEELDRNPEIPNEGDNLNSLCFGYESLFSEILTLIDIHDRRASPSGVLLTGPAGVGKTSMANCIIKYLASHTSAYKNVIQYVSARDLILTAASSLSTSDPSSVLRNIVLPDLLVQRTYKDLANRQMIRIVLILDDLDVLNDPNEESADDSLNPSRDPERASCIDAIVRSMDLLLQMDNRMLTTQTTDFPPPPFILGISRDQAQRQALPSSLLRVNRFEKIVPMNSPTQSQRESILHHYLDTASSPSKNRWTTALARQTAGCLAADLERIVSDALVAAASRELAAHTTKISSSSPNFYHDGYLTQDRVSSVLSTCQVTWQDIRRSAENCIPSQLAELDVIMAGGHDPLEGTGGECPNESFNACWRPIGGYRDVKARIRRTVVQPWKRYLDSTEFGDEEEKGEGESLLVIPPPPGVIFHGPSGCGKTRACMCLAASLGFHVVKVRASDVLNKYLGSSEQTLRSLFSRARSASPCILFLDEIDSLATNRDNDDGDEVHSRILSTLLNEMDGISSSKAQVLVVVATNRLHSVDAALLRQGRLQEHFCMGKPGVVDIGDILRIQTKALRLDPGMDLGVLAETLGGMNVTGADVEGICREACLCAIGRDSDGSEEDAVTMADFLEGMRWHMRDD